MKRLTVLFFIAASIPTDEERAELNALAAREPEVHFTYRNAGADGPADPVERADAYAGKVPDRYRERFPGTPTYGPASLPAETAEADQPPQGTANADSAPVGDAEPPKVPVVTESHPGGQNQPPKPAKVKRAKQSTSK